jgi:hypothetical protein
MAEGNMNLGLWLVNVLILVGSLLWLTGARYLQADTEAALKEPAGGRT